MSGAAVDISSAPSPHSTTNRVLRLAWGLVQATAFRWSPRPAHRWRAMLLRAFGARVSPRARVYPTARVWGPWNLEMGEFATLGDRVDCYCVDVVRIGAHTTVSQYSYLCGATHDHTLRDIPLRPMPIVIGSQAWVAADVFVAPGTTIGDGCVVGARSSVFRDLPEWTVCIGSPAKPIKKRELQDQPQGAPR